jgi:threonylcarbamoyladenosine tRNA methylthiotransferase MtaB
VQKFHVQNFGCRSSQADGAAIESALARNGYAPAGDRKSAEFVILNTCTVTATADDELRQVVRRVHRENPEARIVITGCYAQRAPQELTGLPGVSLVVGNSHKTKIAELLAAPYHGGRPIAAQPQNSGRLFEPVFVLHHSFGARPQPQRLRRAGDPTGARPE